ncbi:MAG TPA: GGDEF domain-containing protein [Candidatus Baltobacteraceae bacterium]|nr:GGDEF domain-containing protein [Candidatus Baltobacteraceae bacterium]
MIELNSTQLLQITLTVECAAMAIVAGVFFLVARATHGARGARWSWGWALFAATLGAEAAAWTFPAHAAALHLAATLMSVANAFFTATASFEFARAGRMPLPAWTVLALTSAAAIATAFRGGTNDSLLSVEVALVGATALTTVALGPMARNSRMWGVKTAWGAAAMVTLLMGRTLVSGAVLESHGEELNALYWVIEIIGGGILAFMLAMGEIVAMLEEIRIELEESNGALNGALQGLETAAKIDALTGLYNRYAFHTIVADLRRHRTLDGAIVVIDLNGLKRINDTFGHYAGDRALRHVAQRLQEMVRASDYVFRWGGDEFVVLLFDVTTEVARERIVHMQPPEPLYLHDRPAVELSVSWGVAPLAYDVENALKEADAQLYDQRRLIRSAAAKLGPV